MSLLNKKELALLPALRSTDDLLGDVVVWVKWFTPDSSWIWYLIEYDPAEDLAFGLVQGLEEELGYFRMEEIEDVRGPLGLHVEKDLFFLPTMLKDLRRRGSSPKRKIRLPFSRENFQYLSSHSSNTHIAWVHRQIGTNSDWQMAVSYIKREGKYAGNHPPFNGYYLVVFRMDNPAGGEFPIRGCTGQMMLVRKAEEVNSGLLQFLSDALLQEGNPILQGVIDSIDSDTGNLSLETLKELDPSCNGSISTGGRVCLS